METTASVAYTIAEVLSSRLDKEVICDVTDNKILLVIDGRQLFEVTVRVPEEIELSSYLEKTIKRSKG